VQATSPSSHRTAAHQAAPVSSMGPPASCRHWTTSQGVSTHSCFMQAKLLGHAIPPNVVCAADGVIPMKRAAYACACGVVVWQAPIDFLRVGAWPASLDANHLRTVVDAALLQQYDSQQLFCPGLPMAGFLKGIADAAHKCRPSQVAIHLPVGCTCMYCCGCIRGTHEQKSQPSEFVAITSLLASGFTNSHDGALVSCDSTGTPCHQLSCFWQRLS
jgi:hypothetical protein